MIFAKLRVTDKAQLMMTHINDSGMDLIGSTWAGSRIYSIY